MPLNIPYYNLEELLDIVLVNTKLSQYIIKGLIVGTLENDSVDTIEVNGSWYVIATSYSNVCRKQRELLGNFNKNNQHPNFLK